MSATALALASRAASTASSTTKFSMSAGVCLGAVSPAAARRGVLARLSTELLQRQQVALLGFDMLFSEPEDDAYADLQQLLQNTPNPQSVDHEWLQRLNALTRNDAQLIDSLRGQPVVLGVWRGGRRVA